MYVPGSAHVCLFCFILIIILLNYYYYYYYYCIFVIMYLHVHKAKQKLQLEVNEPITTALAGKQDNNLRTKVMDVLTRQAALQHNYNRKIVQ